MWADPSGTTPAGVDHGRTTRMWADTNGTTPAGAEHGGMTWARTDQGGTTGTWMDHGWTTTGTGTVQDRTTRMGSRTIRW